MGFKQRMPEETPSCNYRWIARVLTSDQGSGLLPKVWDSPLRDGPEICHHNFDLSERQWLPCFGTPRGTSCIKFGSIKCKTYVFKTEEMV